MGKQPAQQPPTLDKLIAEAVDLMGSQQAMSDERSLDRLAVIVTEACALGQQAVLSTRPSRAAVARHQQRAEDLAREMWAEAVKATNPLYPPDAGQIAKLRQIVADAANIHVT